MLKWALVLIVFMQGVSLYMEHSVYTNAVTKIRFSEIMQADKANLKINLNFQDYLYTRWRHKVVSVCLNETNCIFLNRHLFLFLRYYTLLN